MERFDLFLGLGIWPQSGYDFGESAANHRFGPFVTRRERLALFLPSMSRHACEMFSHVKSEFSYVNSANCVVFAIMDADLGTPPFVD